MDVATVTIPAVACEGVPGADAHPMVFLTFGDDDSVLCPYCSHRFRRSEATPPGPVH